MYQVKPEEQHQPHAPVPCLRTPLYKQTCHNQPFGFFQGGPFTFRPEGTTLGNTYQYYRETLNCRLYSCVPPVPVGFSQGPVQFLFPSAPMNYAESPQRALRPHEHGPAIHHRPLKTIKPGFPGTASDLTACQLFNPSSSLPQGVAAAGAHSSHTPLEDVLQKRELRLMKNREAARECRRKKKEYVRCLENRVAVLENQNKTLIEELRALKDIYRHKVE